MQIYNFYYFLFILQLACTVKSTNKKRIIPVIVRVSDINDNAPKFINTPYETTVPEVNSLKLKFFHIYIYIYVYD